MLTKRPYGPVRSCAAAILVGAVLTAGSFVPTAPAAAGLAPLAIAAPVLHQIRLPNGTFSGFAPVPAPGGAASLGNRVSVAGLPDGSAMIVNIGPDAVLYQQIRRPDGTWTGFTAVPAPGSAPAVGVEVAATAMPDGSVLVADIGPDGVLYQQIRRPDGTWTGFTPVPAPGNAPARASRVSVTSTADGSVHFADIGPDGVLYHQIRRPDGTWAGFTPVPAPGGAASMSNEVSVAGLPNGSILVAVVGPDGVLYHQIRRRDGTWTGFTPVPAPGGAPAQGSRISVAGMPDGSTQMLDVGPDGVVYHQTRRSDGTWTGFVPLVGNQPPASATAVDVAITGTPNGTAHLAIVNRPPGLSVTIEDIRAIFGAVYDTAIVRAGLPSLNAEMQRGAITTPARVAAFLATLRHESGFRYNAVEVNNPSAYRGRGYIQLTGVANYRGASNNVGHDFVNAPDDVATLAWSAPVARYYWTVARPLNADADALNMGLVSLHVGYRWSAAEDVARCDDFKAALRYFTGNVPSGINCIRPGH